MVQWLLQKNPAGLHFLLFITTLKRGGTCAAHGIGLKIDFSVYAAPPRSDFKLDVFKTWRLGAFQPRFGRLQGSILEPPELDFNDFWHILGRCLPSKSSKKCLLKSKRPEMPKMLKRLRRPTFFKGQTPRVRPQRKILPQGPGHKKGGRRWSPPGGYN